MGNKQEKESSKINFDDYKKEYFKAVNRDLKESMKKIKTTLQTENNKNHENDNWVDYLKNKFHNYCANDKNSDKNNKLLVQINSYLNNIGETNESKHNYNLSIFLKKYLDDSVKIKQKSSNRKIISYKICKIKLAFQSLYYLKTILLLTHLFLFLENLINKKIYIFFKLKLILSNFKNK
jgi:hypothetical protein